MKKLKRSTKIYLLSGTIALIGGIILCLILTFLFIGPIKNVPPIPPPPIATSLPTLTVPSEITMGTLDQKRFLYCVKDLGEYQVSVYIESSSVAILNEDIITPVGTGSTKIITSINTSPAIIKETTLNIVESVSNVEFYITDENNVSSEIFFTNTQYILEIRQNATPLQLPEISYENIENFTLINNSGKSMFFNFDVPNENSFTFQYSSTHANLTKSYTAYNRPTTFDVNFTNVAVVNNTINLYLFNNEFKSLANSDGKYSDTKYSFTSDNITIDNIQLIDYDNSILQIENNNIIALYEGTSILKFYSSISKTYKTYTVNVTKVNISKVLINNIQKDIGTVDNIKIDADDDYTFAFSSIPLYTYNEIAISYNLDEINYSNNTIIISDTSINSATITLTYKGTIIYTLNIEIITPVEPVITHLLLLDKKIGEVTLTEYNLTATAGSFAQLTITAYLNGEIVESQDYSLTIEDATLCKHLDDEIINGVINLEFLQTGKTKVDIFDKINNLHIILYVNINN